MLGYVFPRTHYTRDMCSPEGIYVPPVAVICVPQGYVFPLLQGQVQGRHLHPRGETVHHGAVPDLELSPRGRVSPTYVALALYGDDQPPACLQCLSATRIHDPRAETTNYGAEPSLYYIALMDASGTSQPHACKRLFARRFTTGTKTSP